MWLHAILMVLHTTAKILVEFVSRTLEEDPVQCLPKRVPLLRPAHSGLDSGDIIAPVVSGCARVLVRLPGNKTDAK